MGFGAEKWEWVCAGGLWKCGRTVIQRFVSDRSVAQSEELHWELMDVDRVRTCRFGDVDIWTNDIGGALQDGVSRPAYDDIGAFVLHSEHRQRHRNDFAR